MMPNPKKYDDKDKFMEDCMHQTVDVENKPHDQGVAICLNMWKRKMAKSVVSSYRKNQA